MGTKLSTQSSFAAGVDVKVNTSFGVPDVVGMGASVSGGYSTTSQDTATQTISKGQALEVRTSGTSDGVNHAADMFLLLLNPAVAVQSPQVRSNGRCAPATNIAQWYAGLSGTGTEDFYEVYVQWLQDPSTMPQNVASQLSSLKFTSKDYSTILSLDPFAAGSAAIDPTRYILTTWSFPYESPPSSECINGVCTCASISNTIKNELNNTVGKASETKYSLGFSESVSGLNVGIFNFGASSDQNFTWTATATTEDITDSTQSATVTVMCPSANYNGPTEMAVYWDTLFGSFLFVPTVIAPPLVRIAQGHVTNSSGLAVAHQPVQVSSNGKTYHTYTNNAGNYAIYSNIGMPAPAATGQLLIGGLTQTIPMGPSVTQEIRLP